MISYNVIKCFVLKYDWAEKLWIIDIIVKWGWNIEGLFYKKGIEKN